MICKASYVMCYKVIEIKFFCDFIYIEFTEQYVLEKW